MFHHRFIGVVWVWMHCDASNRYTHADKSLLMWIIYLVRDKFIGATWQYINPVINVNISRSNNRDLIRNLERAIEITSWLLVCCRIFNISIIRLSYLLI